MTSDKRRASCAGIPGSWRDSRDSQAVAAAMHDAGEAAEQGREHDAPGLSHAVMLPVPGAAGAFRAAQPDAESCCAIASYRARSPRTWSIGTGRPMAKPWP